MASNDEIVTLLHANHLETVQRLTKLETMIEGVPERLTKLEAKSNWVAGVSAAVAAAFSSGLTIFSLRK